MFESREMDSFNLLHEPGDCIMFRFYVEYENGQEFEVRGLSQRAAEQMYKSVERVLAMNPIRRVGWEVQVI